MRCRCHSGRTEKRCCGPLHGGRAAPTPLALMRSRYAAYARGRIDYIIDTTHPDGPHWRADRDVWREELLPFVRGTRFVGLLILEAPEPDGDSGVVAFRAELIQSGQSVIMEERSTFRRADGRWLYVDGTPVGPGAP